MSRRPPARSVLLKRCLPVYIDLRCKCGSCQYRSRRLFQFGRNARQDILRQRGVTMNIGANRNADESLAVQVRE